VAGGGGCGGGAGGVGGGWLVADAGFVSQEDQKGKYIVYKCVTNTCSIIINSK